MDRRPGLSFSLDLPDDFRAKARLLAASDALAREVARFAGRVTEGVEHGRLITGLALQRALADFYARVAVDHNPPDLAPELAAQEVRATLTIIADLAASLASQHLGRRS